MLRCISNLEELIVEDCASVKVIIEMEGQTINDGAILPCLEKAELHYLPQLLSFSNGVYPVSTTHSGVYACPKLEKLHNSTTHKYSWDDSN